MTADRGRSVCRSRRDRPLDRRGQPRRRSPRGARRRRRARAGPRPGRGTRSPAAWRTAGSGPGRGRSSPRAWLGPPAGRAPRDSPPPGRRPARRPRARLAAHGPPRPGRRRTSATTRRSIRSHSSARGRSSAKTATPAGAAWLVLGLELAQRPARRRDHLQGADHPPAVVGYGAARRSPGRAPPAGRAAPRRPRGRPPPPAPDASAGSAPGPANSPRKQRLEVERGPADEQHALAPRLDLGDRLPGPAPVLGDAGRFPGVEHVDQVMRNSPPLRQRRLGGADVHPAVERHRVERDDLGPEPARQRHADRRLARRGRAGQVNRAMQRIIEHVVHHPGIASLQQGHGLRRRQPRREAVKNRPDAGQERRPFVT